MSRLCSRLLSLSLSLITVALVCLPLCSCDGKKQDDPAKTVEITSDYTIIRPSGASELVKSAAVTVRQAYSDAGVKLSLTEDWVRTDDDFKELEILIGATNRPESAAAAAALDAEHPWSVTISGKKLVIAALSDVALLDAVTAFSEKTINKGNGISLMSGFSLTGDASGNRNISFLWKDADKSVIRSGSWGPRVYTLGNGSLISAVETGGGIITLKSSNNAQSWTSEAHASFKSGFSCANCNLFEFDGKLYLAYRATGQTDSGFYTSLQVSVSTDDGISWKHHSTIAEYTEPGTATRGVWEPCLGELNGALTCFYANDSSSVTSAQNIESLTWNGSAWADRKIISNGASHSSRDGMPVWIKLSSGGYACVIESQKYVGSGHPFIIQLLYSEDGVKWNQPLDVYIPTSSGSKAGAPGIVELSSGQLVISFQTDEDATEKGDKTSVMKTVTSDGTPAKYIKTASFTKSDSVFATPDGEGSVWSGIWYQNGFLYASAGTKSGSSLAVINVG